MCDTTGSIGELATPKFQAGKREISGEKDIKQIKLVNRKDKDQLRHPCGGKVSRCDGLLSCVQVGPWTMQSVDESWWL